MNLRKYLALMVIVILAACQANQTARGSSIDTVAPSKKQLQSDRVKTFDGKFEFIRYEPDFDYLFIEVKDGKALRSFIIDDFDEKIFLRGDSVELTWKKDTIYIAGDSDTPQPADRMTSIKKIKDGKVSDFRMRYQYPLRYLFIDSSRYSDEFIDKIYLLVEYYIASADNQIIKLILKKNDPSLIYSIEESERNGRKYYMIGIAENFEDRFNYFQWLFIDVENYSLYEYDLPNDKLIPFL